MGTAVIFPGQGSQFVGDGRPVGGASGRSRRCWTEASDGPRALDRRTAATTRTPWRPPTSSSRPCSPATSRRSGARGRGARPDVVGVAGHSLGEFAALVAADAVVLAGRAGAGRDPRSGDAAGRRGASRRDGRAARRRGRRLRRRLCADVREATTCWSSPTANSPAQSVASGSIAAIERLEAAAKERKMRAVRLQVAGAFHSELMRPAVQPVLEVLAGIEMPRPRVPDRRERHRRARHRRPDAARARRPPGGLPGAMGDGRPHPRRRRRHAFLEAGPGRRAHQAAETDRPRRHAAIAVGSTPRPPRRPSTPEPTIPISSGP